MVGGPGHPAVITLIVAPGHLAPGTIAPVPEEEAHHLRVRRGADAEPVRLVDGRGTLATGAVRWQGREATVEVEQVERRPPPPTLVLAAGAGDRDRFLLLVEKAAELGATLVVPLATERSGSVATGVRASHLPRLQRRALEALKQCGAAWAPEVAPPEDLAHFLARPLPGARWLADADGAVPPAGGADALAVAVGPEGGFTDTERAQLVAGGFSPVRLGPNILRFDTAAIAALTAAWVARQRESHGS